MTKTIRLYNNGTFYFANLVPSDGVGAGKCGPEENLVFKYEVEIKGFPEMLDEKCFIVDVNEIDKYFQTSFGQNKTPITLSCEQIALRALDDFLLLLEKCQDKLVLIKVKIRATPYSYFEAEWSSK